MAFEKRNFEMFVARHTAGMTQQELAKKVGTSANYISKIESNIEKGSRNIHNRIATVLGTEAEKIFGVRK